MADFNSFFRLSKVYESNKACSRSTSKAGDSLSGKEQFKKDIAYLSAPHKVRLLAAPGQVLDQEGRQADIPPRSQTVQIRYHGLSRDPEEAWNQLETARTLGIYYVKIIASPDPNVVATYQSFKGNQGLDNLVVEPFSAALSAVCRAQFHASKPPAHIIAYHEAVTRYGQPHPHVHMLCAATLTDDAGKRVPFSFNWLQLVAMREVLDLSYAVYMDQKFPDVNWRAEFHERDRQFEQTKRELAYDKVAAMMVPHERSSRYDIADDPIYDRLASMVVISNHSHGLLLPPPPSSLQFSGSHDTALDFEYDRLAAIFARTLEPSTGALPGVQSVDHVNSAPDTAAEDRTYDQLAAWVVSAQQPKPDLAQPTLTDESTDVIPQGDTASGSLSTRPASSPDLPQSATPDEGVPPVVNIADPSEEDGLVSWLPPFPTARRVQPPALSPMPASPPVDDVADEMVHDALPAADRRQRKAPGHPEPLPSLRPDAPSAEGILEALADDWHFVLTGSPLHSTPGGETHLPRPAVSPAGDVLAALATDWRMALTAPARVLPEIDALPPLTLRPAASPADNGIEEPEAEVPATPLETMFLAPQRDEPPPLALVVPSPQDATEALEYDWLIVFTDPAFQMPEQVDKPQVLEPDSTVPLADDAADEPEEDRLPMPGAAPIQESAFELPEWSEPGLESPADDEVSELNDDYWLVRVSDLGSMTKEQLSRRELSAPELADLPEDEVAQVRVRGDVLEITHPTGGILYLPLNIDRPEVHSYRDDLPESAPVGDTPSEMWPMISRNAPPWYQKYLKPLNHREDALFFAELARWDWEPSTDKPDEPDFTADDPPSPDVRRDNSFDFDIGF